jgi:hypothetical protein
MYFWDEKNEWKTRPGFPASSLTNIYRLQSNEFPNLSLGRYSACTDKQKETRKTKKDVHFFVSGSFNNAFKSWDHIAWMLRWRVTKWKGYGRKWPWLNLRYCSRTCLKELRKTTKNLNHGSLSQVKQGTGVRNFGWGGEQINEIKKIKVGRKRGGKKKWDVKFVKFHATVPSAVSVVYLTTLYNVGW